MNVQVKTENVNPAAVDYSDKTTQELYALMEKAHDENNLPQALALAAEFLRRSGHSEDVCKDESQQRYVVCQSAISHMSGFRWSQSDIFGSS